MDIIESAAKSYKIDLWCEQEYYIEVWVEKDALESVVGQAAERFRLNYFSCRGYTSMTAMWQAAQRLIEKADEGFRPYIIHLGDHDPSGIDMTRDIEERLNTLGCTDLHVDRIALNMDQVELYNPPPNPTKVTDSRSNSYRERFGDDCWELDALEPRVIDDLISNMVEQLINQERFDHYARREREERQQLNKAAEHWFAVSKFLDKRK